MDKPCWDREESLHRALCQTGSVYALQQIYCQTPTLIWSAALAALEDTLKANEIMALPVLIVALILFSASFDTKIY